ncbi:hypothetical protein TNCT_585041 [Trichonephila clavata]|uniref:Uncharacterized protein n=1 Tax=Trichonephila clavata TaxID=2740835 RepID=A0A8X6GIP4_TRICU|nr:hypothetical protein TNCT_585041 [Trichonephila clavata]
MSSSVHTDVKIVVHDKNEVVDDAYEANIDIENDCEEQDCPLTPEIVISLISFGFFYFATVRCVDGMKTPINICVAVGMAAVLSFVMWSCMTIIRLCLTSRHA